MTNIPKAAIEKAIEGGWVARMCVDVEKNYPWYQHAIALDPSFWQALGKALGWEQYSEMGGWNYDREPRMDLTWRVKAHKFFNLMLTEQPTEQFWKDLLA